MTDRDTYTYFRMVQTVSTKGVLLGKSLWNISYSANQSLLHQAILFCFPSFCNPYSFSRESTSSFDLDISIVML